MRIDTQNYVIECYDTQHNDAVFNVTQYDDTQLF